MPEPTRTRTRRWSVALLAVATSLATVATGAGAANAAPPGPVVQVVDGAPDLGPNVTIVDP